MRLHRQTILGFTGYLFIGTASVLIPSIMPSISDEYGAAGLSLAAIGLIFPARAAGSIVGNLLAGVGADHLGYTRLVWLAALLLAGCLALAGIAHPWLLFLAAFVVISASQGALGTGINALTADANPGARASALNTLHGVYGIGAALSPLIFGYLLERGIAWRWMLGGTALLWLAYGLISLPLQPSTGEEKEQRPSQLLDLSMLASGPLLALFAIAFIYNGVAYSLLGWVALFMQESAGFSAFFSISLISVFYVALTVGRFACAVVSERVGYGATLLGLALGITATYPLVALSSTALWVVAGVFLTGLSLSGLFPTAMAYGSRLFPQRAGTISGTLNVSMTLGAMIPPLWTGIIAEQWSFQAALGVNYGMVVALLAVALHLWKQEGRRENLRSFA
ncbi:MAG: MFS transporter [Chloroflexi bacterium]|nr:MFS transporter [Chloroflexota bacterium]